MAATLKLNDTKDMLSIIRSDGTVSDTMSTADVESTILSLGLARADMVPNIPTDWPSGQKATTFRNPLWAVETNQLADDILLHLRHETFGWLHFALGKTEVARLAVPLAKFALEPRANDSEPGSDRAKALKKTAASIFPFDREKARPS